MDSLFSILDQPLVRWGLVAAALFVAYRVLASRLSGPGLDLDRILGLVLGDTWRRFKVDREVAALLEQENHLAAGVILEEAGRDQEAIDAYLKGQEVVAAASLYEKRRKLDKAADLFAQGGEHRRAAELLAKAGRPGRAAAMLEAQGNKLDAAKLYADAGEPTKAGALYLDAGFAQRAAEVYEKNGDFRLAAECFERHFKENVSHATGYASTAPSKDGAAAQRAGRMWDKAGDLGRAAEIYAQGLYFADAADAASRAGEHRRAAELYERAERLEQAAECWDAAGDGEKAAHLRGELAYKEGRVPDAAGCFVAARDYLRAAELYESLEMWKEAGDAYRAGESHAAAGEAYLRAGRKELAATAYQESGEHEAAARLFEEIGDTRRAASLFEKAGMTLRSGQAAAAAGRRDEAITLLQQVASTHENYAEASELLVRLFVENGQHELALGRLQRVLGERPVRRDTLGLYYWLGRAHEAAGRSDQARDTYQQILAEDLRYADVAARSQALSAGASTRAAARPQATAPASDRIGKYQILASLGRGAMGEVHRARDTVLERDVAIKVMTAAIAGESHLKERFEREARAVARLAHPNVVTLYDLGYDAQGAPFIAMELLRGRDLRGALSDGVLDLDAKLEVVAQVLAGLAHAHDAGIVHRDIKPANVFLQDDGTAKILDFGVARLSSAPITSNGAVVGTADYMSPEQVEGNPLDGRSDVFAVGAMLFEMLTGVRPFQGESVVAIFNKITRETLDLGRLPADADHVALRPILERALAKDPEQRYQTAAEFAADVRALQMRRLSPGGRAETSWPPMAAGDETGAAAAGPTPEADLPPDRFREVADIGNGPCGRVRRARDTKHDRLVALRTLPPIDAETSRLLVADLKTAAALVHPNVARVFGVLAVGDTRHVLTELVEGRDCATPLLSRRRMSLAQVVALGRVLADALHAIHAKGLVHGSVQPSNIVFSEGAFKLTDLGLGRLARSRPASPYRVEDAVGSDADLRAVVAVLYHLYTAEAPGAGDVRPPGVLRADTPKGFDHLIARGLSSDRAMRFASADELAAALAKVGA